MSAMLRGEALLVKLAGGRRFTVPEAAIYFGRAERTIRWWCLSGNLIAFNCTVIRRPQGNWEILVPPES